MSATSAYCKAYHLGDFRKFPQWTEKPDQARSEEDDSDEANKSPRRLSDDSILYLHDNYVVTDGVFLDEHVIFDDVTATWKDFCAGTLGFSVPDYAIDDSPESQP